MPLLYIRMSVICPQKEDLRGKHWEWERRARERERERGGERGVISEVINSPQTANDAQPGLGAAPEPRGFRSSDVFSTNPRTAYLIPLILQKCIL